MSILLRGTIECDGDHGVSTFDTPKDTVTITLYEPCEEKLASEPGRAMLPAGWSRRAMDNGLFFSHLCPSCTAKRSR